MHRSGLRFARTLPLSPRHGISCQGEGVEACVSDTCTITARVS